MKLKLTGVCCAIAFAIILTAALGSIPRPAQATSYAPGYEPYTYGYAISVFPESDPIAEYLGYLEGYLPRATWRYYMGIDPYIVYTFANSNTVCSEWYAFTDNVWIVYYNYEGNSTQVVIIPKELPFGGGAFF